MILQRGDIIHLAIPSSGNKLEDKNVSDQLSAWYASHGIEAQVVLQSTRLTTATVVAVIRNRPEKPKGSPQSSGALTAS